MRIEKIAILDEVVARVKDSDYCFIVNHGGVTVAQFAKLRKALKALDSRLLVVKNSFLGKVAKAIMEFVKDSGGKASVKGADYDNKIVDAAMVEALSKVPGKDQLRATLLMLLKEPATRLARVLSEKAKKEGGAPAEAPAEPPAA